jgi:hypothetical protein
MTEEKCFQEVTIPSMSSSVSKRLMAAIAPALGQPGDSKDMKKLRGCLKSVLSTALKIRALSLFGDEYYESIWPPIGSAFNGDSMETGRTGSHVKRSICPGLESYSKDTTMVQYDGFGHDEMPCTVLKYVVKAMVLC